MAWPLASVHMSRRPASARPRVTSSAYSRSPPTGRPLASRVTRVRPAQPVGDVGGSGLAGHVRVGREHDLLDAVALHAREQLVDAEVLRLDAVERRERPAEHVVDAAVLVGALHREHVGRLLDDADERLVAPRVEADDAELLLGQVPALAAEADALLRLADRLASASASSSGTRRRWNARRCAVRVPMPGRRESCAIRFSTTGLNTSARSLPTGRGGRGPSGRRRRRRAWTARGPGRSAAPR